MKVCVKSHYVGHDSREDRQEDSNAGENVVPNQTLVDDKHEIENRFYIVKKTALENGTAEKVTTSWIFCSNTVGSR